MFKKGGFNNNRINKRQRLMLLTPEKGVCVNPHIWTEKNNSDRADTQDKAA